MLQVGRRGEQQQDDPQRRHSGLLPRVGNSFFDTFLDLFWETILDAFLGHFFETLFWGHRSLLPRVSSSIHKCLLLVQVVLQGWAFPLFKVLVLGCFGAGSKLQILEDFWIPAALCSEEIPPRGLPHNHHHHNHYHYNH